MKKAGNAQRGDFTQVNTTYSNVINFRATEKEIMFAFFVHFPDKPGDNPPADMEPEVRVVMHISALEPLSKALSQAIEARDKGQQTTTGSPQTKKNGGEK